MTEPIPGGDERPPPSADGDPPDRGTTGGRPEPDPVPDETPVKEDEAPDESKPPDTSTPSDDEERRDDRPKEPRQVPPNPSRTTKRTGKVADGDKLNVEQDSHEQRNPGLIIFYGKVDHEGAVAYGPGSSATFIRDLAVTVEQVVVNHGTQRVFVQRTSFESSRVDQRIKTYVYPETTFEEMLRTLRNERVIVLRGSA